ncbi:hypothetical protein DFH07DRAFT_765087 [Mycena maculata]|nr:hypothetical protein DFH07DRAFT_765087 [Mycena maculata]
MLEHWLTWHAVCLNLTAADNYGGYGEHYATTGGRNSSVNRSGWGAGGGAGGWGVGGGAGWAPGHRWHQPWLGPPVPKTPQKKKRRKERLRAQRAAATEAATLLQAELQRIRAQPTVQDMYWAGPDSSSDQYRRDFGRSCWACKWRHGASLNEPRALPPSPGRVALPYVCGFSCAAPRGGYNGKPTSRLRCRISSSGVRVVPAAAMAPDVDEKS